MSTIVPYTSSCPFNLAMIDELGGLALATGGGHVAAPPCVTTAGSADCVATLYDGASASGTPLATFSLAETGAAMMPNSGFTTGLFISASGTTAGVLEISYTGAAA